MNAATVLLVDDDDGLSHALWHALTACGHDVTHCSTIGNAYSTIACGLTCDILVLDLAVGVDRGEHLVARLRADERPVPPIIITSGEPLVELRRAGRNVGACRVLQKPFTLSSLLDAIAIL
jgi:DNA-binding response OmpR family regulator